MNKWRKELPKFFKQILNITEPCYIAKIEQQGNTINIYVDFKKGAKFEYNGKYYNAYDTVQSWSKKTFSKSKDDN